MISIKPPNPLVCKKNLPKIFLAGTIDMGEAYNWQADVEQMLVDLEGYIFNPLRDQFDFSAEQSIHNPYFRGQVNWELDAQTMADVILMNYLPNSRSVISLLELGLFVKTGKMIVCCPEGFYRKGNVDIVCDRFDVPVFTTLNDAVNATIKKITQNN